MRLERGIKKDSVGAGLLLWAFLLPVGVFALVCALSGFWPFSSLLPLGGDMVGQYLEYYCWMKDVFAGEADAFYSLSKTLGGDMTGIWAYYLLSPLNLLLLPVSRAALPLAVMGLIGAKLGLCSLFMALFLSRRGGGRGVLIFSAAYALMSYNMSYYNNLMWLDGVYILPLILLGLERLFEGRAPFLYIFALAFALVTNYYIGYMICLFLVLYFIWRWAAEGFGGRQGFLRAFARFALASLLAGLASAAVLLPTALALGGTKAGFDSAWLGMSQMYTLGEHLRKLVCAAMPTGNVEGDHVLSMLPHIYCGALTGLFTLLYFFNPRIPLRRRLVTALGFVSVFLSFNLNGGYVVWHAFNYPAWFPYRCAFLLSLMLLLCGCEGFRQREGLGAGSAVLTALALAAALLLIDPLGTAYVSKKMLALDLAVMAVGAAVLLWERKMPSRRGITAVLLIGQLVLLTVNARAVIAHNGSLDSAAFAAEQNAVSADIRAVEELDGSLYRLGHDNADRNAPMRFGYPGLSHFSSTEKQSTKGFAINFGLRHFSDVWVSYSRGAAAGADDFLGVRYVLSEEQPQNYEVVTRLGTGTLYLNENALPLAFPVSAGVLEAELEERDIFLWQEQLWSAALGHEAGVMRRQSAGEPELSNLSARPFGGEGAREYLRVEADKDISLTWRFDAESSLPLYMYTAEPLVEGEVRAELFVNGVSLGDYMGSWNWRAVPLGRFEPGESVEVVIKPLDGFFLQYDTYFYYEDGVALDAACAELLERAGDGRLEMLSESRFEWTGSIEEGELLLFTLPADRGWRVTADGSGAGIRRVFGALASLELEPGEHSVSLRYTPPGLYAGAALSALGVGLIALWAALYNKRKK